MLIFYDDGYTSKNTIDQGKINSTNAEAFEKTTGRLENATSKNKEVHKRDIGDHHVQKDQWLLVAIALYRHWVKVTTARAESALNALN